MEAILRALAEDLRVRGDLDLQECFIDGTFVVAKKGATGWERPGGAKVRSSWPWQRALIFLSPHASQVLAHIAHEVTLVESTLAGPFAPEPPKRLIGDRAYDGKPLDACLATRGMR